MIYYFWIHVFSKVKGMHLEKKGIKKTDHHPKRN